MKDPKLATRLDLSDTLNYDNGKLKDATTPTAKDGTLINSWLLSDIRTVFTRAVKIAGTVFSGNFDTDNSSQLFDALKKTHAWIDIDGPFDLGPGPRMSARTQSWAYELSRCMTCGCCFEACTL